MSAWSSYLPVTDPTWIFFVVLSIILLAPILLGKLKIPHIVGMILAGVLIGPLCLGALGIPNLGLPSFDFVEKLGLISDVSLGFIAFSIGGEFKLSSMKMLGSRVITITFFQAMTAVLMVDAVLLICGFPAAEALTLGAIAAATAPAATLMVVRQYRAKGPLTSTLLPVVAMDDAVGLIVFAISLALARTFANGSALTVKNMLIDPVVEIVLSLTIGGAIGLLLAVGIRFFHSRANRLMLCLTAVLLGIALALLQAVLLLGLAFKATDYFDPELIARSTREESKCYAPVMCVADKIFPSLGEYAREYLPRPEREEPAEKPETTEKLQNA